MSTYVVWRVLVVSIIAVTVSRQAAADILVRYSADAAGTPVPTTLDKQQNGSISFSGGDGSTQPSFDPNNPTVQSASFIVGSRHGALRAAALTVLSGGQSFAASASASGLASFEDTLTVNAVGMAGLQGTMDVSMVLDGVISESAADTSSPGDAQANVDFSLSATTSLGSPATGVSYGQSNQHDGFSVTNEIYSLQIPFVFGQPFTIFAELGTNSSVQMPNFPGTTSAISAFAQTATWQGISSVRNADGAEVVDYSVSSQSLTNYNGPIAIPEPGTLALVGLGGVALLTFRGRGSASIFDCKRLTRTSHN